MVDRHHSRAERVVVVAWNDHVVRVAGCGKGDVEKPGFVARLDPDPGLTPPRYNLPPTSRAENDGVPRQLLAAAT